MLKSRTDKENKRNSAKETNAQKHTQKNETKDRRNDITHIQRRKMENHKNLSQQKN